MENCLVTKLKAAVTNDNMPILNTIVLDDYDANSLPDAPNIMFMAGATKIHLKCKVPMYSTTSYTDGVLERDVTPNSRFVARFKQSEIQALASKKDFLVITEGVYDIVKIGNSNFITMNNLVNSGLSSQRYNQNLICYGCTGIMNDPIKDLPTSVEFTYTGKVYDEWFASPYALKYVLGGSSANIYEIPLNNATKNNTTVRVMSSLNGNIQNVPKNIVRCSLVYKTKGSIEELVASMIERGRTSGSIKIGIASATWVTYGGTRLGQLYNTAKVLVWNNSTITFQDEETEEIAAYPDWSMYSYPVS